MQPPRDVEAEVRLRTREAKKQKGMTEEEKEAQALVAQANWPPNSNLANLVIYGFALTNIHFVTKMATLSNIS